MTFDPVNIDGVVVALVLTLVLVSVVGIPWLLLVMILDLRDQVSRLENTLVRDAWEPDPPEPDDGEPIPDYSIASQDKVIKLVRAA